MKEPKKKAFTLDIYETYKKTVIVYAENIAAAANMADVMRFHGEIGNNDWTPVSREVSHQRKAAMVDYSLYEHYGFD